jgi:hypothetical protein
MEGGKNQHFWLCTENLAIGRIFFSKSGKFGPFFHGKTFLLVEIIFFR